MKICGITSCADAEAAVAAGVDAIGIVCAPSPRRVPVEGVREIVASLPAGVLSFGVFRNEEPGRVVETVRASGLSGVQLHGEEDPAEVAWIAARVGCVIKALPWGQAAPSYEVHQGAWALLVDSVRPGSGERADWDHVRLPAGTRTIVAGGLRPENVAEAILRFQPFGVDVASGVEQAPGRKDPERMAAFVHNAREAARRVERRLAADVKKG